ncbi:MAG: tyrosine-protein phosphatase, partial [Clostridia bacterium]|nr:tyrosine-protein phosphatase [Clostridia bacterium]
GVVSAVLLHRLGMPTSYIVDDYMKSRSNLEDLLREYARKNPAVNIDVITPKRRYMEEFLAWYIANA